MTASRTPTRLALQPLEDRTVPAAPSYNPLTQTLTITGANADVLTVSAIPTKPTGYLSVVQGMTTVFNSDVTNQSVRNLVVRFNTVASGTVTLDSSVRLGGNLSVFGGTTTQLLTLAGTVGGNVTYTGTLGATDDVTVEATAQVGANATFKLGAGANTARLRGGIIRGNLAVNGLAGVDKVELTSTTDLTVVGSAAFNLGTGANTVQSLNLAQVFRVGTNFSYRGGVGTDTFDLDGSGTALQVGGDASFMLSGAMGTDNNLVVLEALSVGRHAKLTGGLGSDTVRLTGGLIVGGNFTAGLSAGDNVLDVDTPGTSINEVGGGFTYTGGGGRDEVALDGTTIGKALTVNLGETTTGGQFFRAGAGGAGAVTAFGAVKVTAGAGDDEITLHRLYAGTSLTVMSGAGDDQVGINDSDLAGPTRIDLGAGDDRLRIEMVAIDLGGALTAPTTFGGTLTVLGGAGDDTVDLSNDLPMAATFIHFGSRISLTGGAGVDVLNNSVENQFEVTGNFEDFEVSPVPPLP
ncbi:MAG TPA: hypothetical protein VKD90_09080 [Gemmataceae bacterium]|nr:hypothetical protein [Gemmataceae bacterium]